MKKIDIIQALRGIAAILVVLYHIRPQLSGSLTGRLVSQSGAMGVDLFFVISGFIMVYTSGTKTGFLSGVKFLINRFSRVEPLYVFATIVFVILFHGAHWLVSYSNIFSLVRTFLFISPNPGDAAPFYGYAQLRPGWTLNYEMFFYLIFGVSMLAGKWRWQMFFGVFLVLLFILPLATGNLRISAYTLAHYKPAYLNFLTDPIIMEFLAGVVLGFIYKSALQLSLTLSSVLTLLGIGILVYGYYATGFLCGHGPYGWGIGSALLIFSLLMFNKSRQIKVAYPLVFLGNISYSIYLMHVLVSMLLHDLLKHTHSSIINSNLFFVLVFLSSTILVSWFTQQFIEQWVSNYVKKALLAPLNRIVNFGTAKVKVSE